jgi:hypothetical protein
LPLALERFVAPSLSIVIKFPAVPETSNLVIIVVVVPPVNQTVYGAISTLNSFNVEESYIVIGPAPTPETSIL